MPRVEVKDKLVPLVLERLSYELGADSVGGVCRKCEAHHKCVPKILEISGVIGRNGFPRRMVLEGSLMESGNKHCSLLR